MMARSRSFILLACSMTCGVVGLSLAGCSDPLLSPNEPRSPYDRYDAVRQQHAPQYIENEFGRREPNLRGRLTPKE